MPTPAAPSASAWKSLPDAAIEEHGHAAARRGRDLGQAVERSAQRFFVATAVVGNDDSVRALVERDRRVLAGHDAFE